MKMFGRFVREEQGQDLIEYALLAGFIGLAAVVGVTAVGTQLNDWYNALATYIEGIAPA